MNTLGMKHAEKTNNILFIFFFWQIWVIYLFLYKGGKLSQIGASWMGSWVNSGYKMQEA